MGFKDLVAKAVTGGKREGDYVLPNQRGILEVQEFKTFKTDSGPIAVLLGKLLEVAPKVAGQPTQSVGSLLKIFVALYGGPKKREAGYANVKRMVTEVSGCSEEELPEALSAIFGDKADEGSDAASDEAKKHPLFAARGILVGFDSKLVEYTKDDKTKGEATRVYLKHIEKGNEPEAVEARQKNIAKETKP